MVTPKDRLTWAREELNDELVIPKEPSIVSAIHEECIRSTFKLHNGDATLEQLVINSLGQPTKYAKPIALRLLEQIGATCSNGVYTAPAPFLLETSKPPGNAPPKHFWDKRSATWVKNADKNPIARRVITLRELMFKIGRQMACILGWEECFTDQFHVIPTWASLNAKNSLTIGGLITTLRMEWHCTLVGVDQGCGLKNKWLQTAFLENARLWAALIEQQLGGGTQTST